MPLTEPYKPMFDTGMQQRAEPELIEPEAPPRRRRWWHRRSDAAVDEPASGFVPTAYTQTDAPPSEALPAITVDDQQPASEVVEIHPDTARGLGSRRGHRRRAVLLVEPRRFPTQNRGGLRRAGLCGGVHGRRLDPGDGARPAAGVRIGNCDALGGVRLGCRRSPGLRQVLLRAQPAGTARQACCRTERAPLPHVMPHEKTRHQGTCWRVGGRTRAGAHRSRLCKGRRRATRPPRDAKRMCSPDASRKGPRSLKGGPGGAAPRSGRNRDRDIDSALNPLIAFFGRSATR